MVQVIGMIRNQILKGAMAGALLLLMSASPGPMAQDELKVILVDLNVQTPADAPKAYSTAYDRKKVELVLKDDDPINFLEDFSMAEDPLEGPDCFMPEMKVIFEGYTYIFSLYCTSVRKYANSAPFTPSAKRVQPDIEVTESVLSYLESTRKKYFGVVTDNKLIGNFVKDVKFEEEKVDDSDLLKDDNDDDDKEMQKDAIDKEGWFDEKKDPGLEEDNTPDVPDDDGQ